MADEYTYRNKCPRTKKYLTEDNIMQNGGVCIACGHDNESTIGHYEREIGQWVNKGFFDWNWIVMR